MHKFLATTLVCVGMAAAPVAAGDQGIYGYKGAQTARDECPPGQYLVGLVGSAGLWLDQIAVVCAALEPDTTWNRNRARTIASRGGSGGSLQQKYCATDKIVTSVTIQRTKNEQIDNVNLTCTSTKTALTTPDYVVFGGSGNYAGSSTQGCPAGEAATGLTISYGQYVSGVGLICGTFKAPAAALCAAGKVWRESFEGDAACVTPDARFRKPDGTCRSGYVWRNLVDGDNVCVTPNDQKKAWVAAGKPLEGTTSGSSGGFIQMIPTGLLSSRRTSSVYCRTLTYTVLQAATRKTRPALRFRQEPRAWR